MILADHDKTRQKQTYSTEWDAACYTQTAPHPMAGGKPVLSRDMQHFKHHLKTQHS